MLSNSYVVEPPGLDCPGWAGLELDAEPSYTQPQMPVNPMPGPCLAGAIRILKGSVNYYFVQILYHRFR